jgi:hypothetical protein
MKKTRHWLMALGSVTLLALLIQPDGGHWRLWAAGAPAAGGMPVPTPGDAEAAGNFSAAPAPSAAPAGGNAFAGAAGQAGFQKPTQVIDLTEFTVSNKLPPGYTLLNIKKLASFPFDGDYEEQTDPFSEPKKLKHPRRAVPADVKALNGKKVALTGFMLPFEYRLVGASHFALLKSQAGCCFGVAPKLNEWIDVHMTNMGKLYMDTPVLVLGTLKVGEIREYGNLMGLYALQGEKIEKAVIPELDDTLIGPLSR